MWDWENPPLPIQRVEVPNSGFMRDQPTNCYILGEREVVVVDPGSEPGVDAIPAELERRGNPAVKAIYLTHAHPDHAIAVPELRRLLEAPVMLHPDNKPIMRQYLSWEDIDVQIDPSRPLEIEGVRYEIVMTPGHAPGHAALFNRETGVFLAGDLVSGYGTIGVFPPNGSMREYIDSLCRARDLEPSVLLPGHGPVIEDPPALFAHYLERRLGRERQILELLRPEGTTIDEILPVLYPDLLPENSFPARATILAHLLKLQSDGRATPLGENPETSPWAATP